MINQLRNYRFMNIALIDAVVGIGGIAFIGSKVLKSSLVKSTLVAVPSGIIVHKILGVHTEFTDFWSLDNSHAYHSGAIGGAAYLIGSKVMKLKSETNAIVAMSAIVGSALYMMNYQHSLPDNDDNNEE